MELVEVTHKEISAAFAYKCAQRAIEAAIRLESLRSEGRGEAVEALDAEKEQLENNIDLLSLKFGIMDEAALRRAQRIIADMRTRIAAINAKRRQLKIAAKARQQDRMQVGE